MKVKTPWLPGLLTSLLISTRVINAQESANFEKIRDMPPDQKFAVRISCSSEPDDPNNIDPNLIIAVELVSLRSKKVVMNLPQHYDGRFAGLIWSQDSKWFALSASSGPRVTDTYVYHRSGDAFREFETEHLMLHVKGDGDVRNEYVTPVRWTKPGVLLLEQFSSFGGRGDESATFRVDRFTVSFDEKTGKSRIISKKKLPSNE